MRSYRKALLASFTARRTAETLEAEGAKTSAIQDAIATQTEKESEAQSMLEQVNGLFEQWQEAAVAVETDDTSLLFYPLLGDVPQAWDALYTYDNFLKGLGLIVSPAASSRPARQTQFANGRRPERASACRRRLPCRQAARTVR